MDDIRPSSLGKTPNAQLPLEGVGSRGWQGTLASRGERWAHCSPSSFSPRETGRPQEHCNLNSGLKNIHSLDPSFLICEMRRLNLPRPQNFVSIHHGQRQYWKSSIHICGFL